MISQGGFSIATSSLLLDFLTWLRFHVCQFHGYKLYLLPYLLMGFHDGVNVALVDISAGV